MKVKSLVVIFASLLFAVACSSTPKMSDTKAGLADANTSNVGTAAATANSTATNSDATKNANNNSGASSLNGANNGSNTAQNSAQNSATAGAKANAVSADAASVNGKMIHFAFDSFTIDQQNFAVLTQHANFIKASAPKKVVVEGNTDERGSREYNLALGERRAIAVKKALEGLGVNGKVLETVSFGAEKPVNNAQGEDAWQQNRRVELNYGK